jgi:DNA-binding CsgD family transcriptional regulator
VYPRDSAPAHREAALAWLDTERHNLLALVRHHRRFGDPAVCWTVPDALRGYYQQRRRLRDWMRMADIGLAAARHEQNVPAQAAMHLTLGMASFAANQLPDAEDHYQRTVKLALGAGWQEIEAAAYRNLAGVALAHGDTATSEKYLALWTELNERVGLRLDPAVVVDDTPRDQARRGTSTTITASTTAAASTTPAAAPANRANLSGRAASASSATPITPITPTAPIAPVTPAAETPHPAHDAAAAEEWSVLSRREQTVARLVVQGLTNQQIAKRIRCSPETVKFHLRNIFRKLGIGSRVEIARFVLAARALG